jgi:hypothetical protein
LIVSVGLGWAFSRLDNGQGLKITANVLVICIIGAVFVSGLDYYRLLHIDHKDKRK